CKPYHPLTKVTAPATFPDSLPMVWFRTDKQASGWMVGSPRERPSREAGAAEPISPIAVTGLIKDKENPPDAESRWNLLILFTPRTPPGRSNMNALPVPLFAGTLTATSCSSSSESTIVMVAVVAEAVAVTESMGQTPIPSACLCSPSGHSTSCSAPSAGALLCQIRS